MAQSVASSSTTSFWNGIGDNMRRAINDAIPEAEQTLEISVAATDFEPKTIEEKHDLIRKLAEKELQARNGSTEKDTTRKLTHLIAMLDPESVAAWHRLLQNDDVSRPNLAALFNLAYAYSEEGRYLESEALIRALIPLLQKEIRTDAPQVLGGIRMLAACVFKQGRKEEASQVLDVARLVRSLDLELIRCTYLLQLGNWSWV